MNKFTFNIQRFTDDEKKTLLRESTLPHLRMICNVANTPIFSGFISLLENNKDSLEKIDKYISPIFDLISAFYQRKYPENAPLKIAEEVELFAATISISNSILDVCDRMAGKKFLEASEELGNIANEMLGVCDTLLALQAESGIKLNKTEETNDFFIPIITATISYGLATLSTFEEEGLTPEVQSDINKALVKLGGATLEALLSEVLDNADEITTPFGPADVGLSVLIGILEGFNKYSEQFEYYRDDGLPEDIAKKEAILDAVSGGMHEAMSNYLHGVDDVAFEFGKALGEGCKWVGAFFSGTLDSFEFSSDDKNYAEWVREAAMRASYGTSSFDDEIEIDPSNPKVYPSIYAQDGNDIIKNIYPKVTIYGGHGDDSISLYEDATFNSVFGGNGDDYLYAYDRNNTLYGGAGNDFFLVIGNKNVLLGEDGDEKIFAKGTGNSITGGAGDDLMLLDGAKNAVIEYTAGDGTDAIYGYDTSNLIKIKGEYSTQVSGNDIIIQVGKGGIIVKDAKDLKLNLNTIEADENETLDNDTQGGFTPFSSGIVFAPTFRDFGNALRGTNDNDKIENTLDNVMIYGFDGNDTIINYGNNVTINAGAGNDHVLNYGDSVKVNGGDGNDYIYSEGYKATINGNDGKDTVNNTGNNSLIDGGADMDSIKNSGEGTDINSGGGNDRIVNEASNVRATGYLDDNYISNTENNVTLEGSNDKDIIYNSGDNVSINAGEGNNSVSIDGAAGGYQTIEAGDGQNTIQVGDRDETESKRYHNQIYVGNGNNYIDNSNVEGSTISAGDGNDTIITGGDDSSWYYTSIEAGAGNNIISVTSSLYAAKITADKGNDFVSIVSGNSNLISTRDGNDSIITSGNYSTINVGVGKNFVTLNAGSYSNSVIAGNDDDFVLINDSGEWNNISLGAGNNTVISTNGRENVYTGDGDDMVTVKGGYISVGGGKNNVSLTTSGSSSVIAGAGDDSINVKDHEETEEQQYYNYIDADDGNNYINNNNVEKSTIIAGSGNDTIITGGSNDSWYYTSINAGAGNNLITVNSGMIYLRIYAGGGNDFVSIAGAEKYNGISLNSGDDSVITGGSNSTINVGEDKNFVTLNAGSSSNSIIAGNGDDSVLINNSGGYNNISLGSGNNTVISASGRENIYTGDGDDKVTVMGGYISVGGGKNSVSLNSDDIEIISGAGDDTINVADIGEKRYSNRIYAGGGNNYIYNSNVERSTITAGSGNDTIITGGGTYYNSYSYTSINAGVGNNKITVNSGMTYGKITAGIGNDFVSIGGDGNYNIISVSDGRNTIFTNHYYETNYNQSNTIEAGTGSDLVYTSGNSSFINAGSGCNLISLAGGQYNSLITGKGDDTITLSADANNNIIIFGGGNDLVYNYHDGDTVFATGVLTQRASGTDVILTDGTSEMTLKNAKGKAIHTETLSSNDEIYKILVADKTVGDTILPDGIDTIVPDISPSALDILNDTDSISITGTVLNDTISNSGSSVSIIGGADDDLISLLSNSKNNFVQYSPGDGNDSIYGFDSTDSLSISSDSYSKEIYGNDIIITVGESKITLIDAATLSAININGEEEYLIDLAINNKTNSPLALPAYTEIADASKRTKAIKITGNELDNSIIGGKGNDSLDGAAGSDVLNGSKGNDLFIFSGGDDIITDYENKDKLSIGGGLVYEDYTIDGKNLILNFGTDNDLTIKDGANKIISYLEDKKTTIYQYNADGVILDGKKKSATLTSTVEKFDANSKDYSKVVTIDGSETDAIEIIGNKKKNYIIAGTSDSTLNGKKGNDTMVGGEGDDLFVYESKSGKDIIEGYGKGDSIHLDSDVTIKDVKTKKNDTVLKFKGGALTVKGTTTFTFTAGENETLYSDGIFVADDTAKVYGSYKGTINLSAYNANNVDASEGKKKVSIIGTDSDNYLIGGKGKDSLIGNAGDDTLWGGKGNDSLWGGDGDDVFIFRAGEGNDVITGYSENDMLQILNKKNDAGDFKKATFKDDKFTLFIDGGGKIIINGVNSNTSVNINGESRKISELTK